MEWGGWAVFLEGKENGDLYISVLADEMLRSVDHCIPEEHLREWVLLQDGASCHTSGKTKKWLEDHQIRVIDHPPLSPDLNPIENLWKQVKDQVFKKKCIYDSKEDLKRAFSDVFYSIERCSCRELIKSMPLRMKEVCKAKGGYINY